MGFHCHGSVIDVVLGGEVKEGSACGVNTDKKELCLI